MNTSILQEESEEEVVSKKPTKELPIQRKVDWLRNGDKKKTISDTDEETNGLGLPSYHTCPKGLGLHHHPSQKGI